MVKELECYYGRIFGYPNDSLFSHLTKGRFFHDLEIKVIIDKYVKKDFICLDVGANFGYVSMYLSKKCKKVISYEPQRMVFYQLCTNLFVNQYTNVYAYNLAVGNEKCKMSLETPIDYARCENIGGLYLVNNNDGDIDCVTLDEHVNEKINFIKIDAEGNDLNVIFGAMNLIKKHRPIIVFEINFSSIKKMDNLDKNEPREIINNFCVQNEYTIREIGNGNYLLKPIEIL